VWLGSSRVPRRPWWSFEQRWSALGRQDGLTVYTNIVRANWQKMLEVLDLSEGIDSIAGRYVHQTVKHQMRALAENLIDPMGPRSRTERHT
jgi:hypothetical protein